MEMAGGALDCEELHQILKNEFIFKKLKNISLQHQF